MWSHVEITNRDLREYKSKEIGSIEMVPNSWINHCEQLVKIPVDLVLSRRYLQLIEDCYPPNNAFDFREFHCTVTRSFGMLSKCTVVTMLSCVGLQYSRVRLINCEHYITCIDVSLDSYEECRHEFFFGNIPFRTSKLVCYFH